ncbi:MAG TPA: trypsin-like peptidase domain-containing protein [Pyrinomonadaceae bacterium]|jgi:S1-C subfamily serine protease|nr:trypsin-like peptidase domain-containing protein [Pyrinomonadaceae bacterium]
MASGLVIHIASGDDRHTEVLSQDRVRIGPGEGCQVRLRSSALPTDSDLILEIARTNGHYRVTEFDKTLGPTLNGEPLAAGDAIDDGDELRFSTSELALQFFPVRDLPAVVGHRRSNVAPFIEYAALEAAATERRDDAKVFLREFTRELLREINLSTKIITLLITLALVGGILYLGNAANKELQRSRDLINKQNEQLVQLQTALDRTNDQFQQVDKSNKNIIESMSLAPRLFSQYGNGVCLISGTYILVEAGTGRPLRYPETQTTEDGVTIQNGGEQPILTPEGSGEPFLRDFVGTGFHVGGGYIITNRHLAVEPWTADDSVQALSASVQGQFRITRIVAFFPGQRQTFQMRLRQSTTRDDLAVGQVDASALPPDIPVLPLDSQESDAAGIGKTIVMMGYPSGPERLLATLPEAESRSVQQRSGASIESLLSVLAGRKAIKPLTTQGHITDLEARRIVYDAHNAVGGSGSPLFGQSGRVIGVNFATFTAIPDTNFAVPIRFIYPLLARAGWKSSEPPAPDANANTAPKDARNAASAPTNQRPSSAPSNQTR